MFSFFRKQTPSGAGAPLLSEIVVHYGTNNNPAIPPTKKHLMMEINHCIKLLEMAKKGEEYDRLIKQILLISGMVVSAGGAVLAGYYLMPGILLSAKITSFGNQHWSGTNIDGTEWICGYWVDGKMVRDKYPECRPGYIPFDECANGYNDLCDLTHNYDDWKKQNPYNYPVGIPGFVVSFISFGVSSVWEYFERKNKRKEEVIKIMKKNDFQLLKQIISDLKIAEVNLATDKVDDLLQKFADIKEERAENINRMYAFFSGSKDPNSNVYQFFATQGKVDVRKHIFDYVCGDESWQEKITFKNKM